MLRVNYIKSILDEIENQSVLCHGIRGVGITTILGQCAEHLSIKHKVLWFSSSSVLDQEEMNQICKSYDTIIIDDIESIKGLEMLPFYENKYKVNFLLGSHHTPEFVINHLTKLKLYEVEICPLLLSEIIEEKNCNKTCRRKQLNEICDNYVKYGGLPKVINFKYVEEKKNYLTNILDEIVEKDIRPFLKFPSTSGIVKTQLIFIFSSCGYQFVPNEYSSDSILSEITQLAFDSHLMKILRNYNRVEKEIHIYMPVDFGISGVAAGIPYKFEDALRFVILKELEDREYELSFYSENHYVDIAIVAEKDNEIKFIQVGFNGEDIVLRRNLDFSLISLGGANTKRYVICVNNEIEYDKRVTCISFHNFMFNFK